MTDRNPNDLCIELQAILPQFIERCAAAGITVRPIVTWRSATDQNDAKLKGLSNASAGASPHNHVDTEGKPCSLAFDFAVFVLGQYIKDGTNPLYAQAGAIAKGLGLDYGGDWEHPDYDHIQLQGWKTYGNPSITV